MVDARFDGHHVPDLQNRVTGAVNKRILVNQEPDAVTCSVCEPVAVAGFLDDAPTNAVKFLGADASRDGGDTRALGGQHDVV